MFNAKMLLDALVSASSRPGGLGAAIGGVIGQAASGLQDATQKAGQAPSLGQKVDQTVGQVASGVASGQKPGDLLQKAKDVMKNNPGLAEAAAIGLAGLLLGGRRSKGVSPSLVKLGGLALVGGLAYKAFENHKAGKPLLDLSVGGGNGAAAGASGGASGMPKQGAGDGGAAASLRDFGVAESSRFHPVSQTDDDALLYLRTMVAAASADGRIDDAERQRIGQGLRQAGIDEDSTRWLEREMASPADIEELAAGVTAPEKAAQVYAAARVAIDPDTIQEREFLRRLAESLDIDEALKAQLDSTAAAVKI